MRLRHRAQQRLKINFIFVFLLCWLVVLFSLLRICFREEIRKSQHSLLILNCWRRFLLAFRRLILRADGRILLQVLRAYSVSLLLSIGNYTRVEQVALALELLLTLILVKLRPLVRAEQHVLAQEL